MLTRIEIDGFKSFENFELPLSPFTVIVGPNAAGKSNLFDALRLLSRLAERDVRMAVQDFRGDPNELFRHGAGDVVASRMRFAVETLVEPEVRDAYGQAFPLKNTRLRYEVELERRLVTGIERLFVVSERVHAIHRKIDRWQPYRRAPSKIFRKMYLRHSGRETPYLDTKHNHSEPRFAIHQDSTQGRVRELPASAAEATVLSTITRAGEFPHLYALREELRNIKYLQLNPAAERYPSNLDAPGSLLADGSNLAAVIYRIQQETRTADESQGAVADILSDLSQLIPGIIDLGVVRDDERREFRLHLTMRDGQRFSSRVVSDGTLRVLALLTLLHDPGQRGVVCFEEPENGISKNRLRQLMWLLRDACAQPNADDIPVGPLLQMVLNTHSPVVAQALKQEIVLAEMAETTVGGEQRRERVTRMRPYVPSEQSDLFPNDPRMQASEYDIERFITLQEAGAFAA